MKNKIIIIFLLLSSVILKAQDNPEKTMELPDFIVNGTEAVNVKTVSKPKPDQNIKIYPEALSRQPYSVDELKVSELSNPIKKDIELFEKKQTVNGRLVLGAGIYQLPYGDFMYTTASENAILNMRVFGVNENAYTKNAGINTAGGELKSDLFPGNLFPIFPFPKLSVDASYNRQIYKFFGSSNPGFQREKQLFGLSAGLKNLAEKNFKYSFKAGDELLSLKEKKTSENQITASGYAEFGYPEFSLIGQMKFKNSSYKSDSVKSTNKSFISGKGQFDLNIENAFDLKFGLEYCYCNSSAYIVPNALFKFKFDRILSFIFEYKPTQELMTTGELIKQNRYFSVSEPVNVASKSRHDFIGTVKYEYETYFEIDGGIKYSKWDALPFFYEGKAEGFFEINTCKADKYGAFMDFLFYQGPSGKFFANVEIEHAKISGGHIVPYSPLVSAEMSYSMLAMEGITCGIKVKYASQTYADVENKIELPAFINLSVSAEKNIYKNFSIYAEATNLLNKKNYYYHGYFEKTLDVTAGIIYVW
jgi:hypothetical protein